MRLFYRPVVYLSLPLPVDSIEIFLNQVDYFTVIIPAVIQFLGMFLPIPVNTLSILLLNSGKAKVHGRYSNYYYKSDKIKGNIFYV